MHKLVQNHPSNEMPGQIDPLFLDGCDILLASQTLKMSTEKDKSKVHKLSLKGTPIQPLKQ